MPPTWPTFAGTSRPPRSERRKRIPKSEGAGLSERVTLLPEWRPIPAHEIDLRSVRCAVISGVKLQRSRCGWSDQDARWSLSAHVLPKLFLPWNLRYDCARTRIQHVEKCGGEATAALRRRVATLTQRMWDISAAECVGFTIAGFSPNFRL